MPSSRALQDRPVVIFGAGLTGMSAALYLQNHGVDHWLIERDAQVGGLASTVFDSGYRFDRTGHLLHLRDPNRRNQVLGMLDRPPIEISRRSFIYSEGVYTRYPYQSNVQGLPPAIAYACVLDFIHAKRRATTTPPANFEAFCRQNFGDSITDRFMLPYNRRLWGVEPNEITTSWCDRFVPIPTLEDVLAGALGHKPTELGYNTTGLYPQAGMGQLSDAMGRRMNSLVLRCEPKRVVTASRRVDFDDWSSTYQHLISSLPLTKLLQLMEDVPDAVMAASRLLRCTPLYYLDVALRRMPKMDLHWAYVPESRFPFYRVGNYAAFSPSMAPPGAACLYVELADRSEPHLADLWPNVEAGLTEMAFIEGPDDVAFCRLRKLEHAYVIYDANREPSMTIIEDYLSSVGITSTGRYGGWNYSSMEDALDFGERAAEVAIEALR